MNILKNNHFSTLICKMAYDLNDRYFVLKEIDFQMDNPVTVSKSECCPLC